MKVKKKTRERKENNKNDRKSNFNGGKSLR